MLTKIEIEGFKSFGSPGVSIGVQPLNFIVGPNAAGKSNFIGALTFLQSAVKFDLDTAVGAFGGAAEMCNKRLRRRRRPRPLRIRVQHEVSMNLDFLEFEGHSLDKLDYELSLDLWSSEQSHSIESERLNASIRDAQGKSLSYTLDRRGQRINVTNEMPQLSQNKEGSETVDLPAYESSRLAINSRFDLPAFLLRQTLLQWKFFNIAPHVARQSYRDIPNVVLGVQGENLSVILNQFSEKNDGKLRDAVELAMRGMVPGFKGVRTVRLPVEGTWAFQVSEDKIIGGINPTSVSDGTVRLLALLSIILSETEAAGPIDSMITIEEPEISLHPHLIPEITAMLELCANSGTQVFVTTHNPDFLDELDPCQIILCDKVDGFTEMVSAESVSDVEVFRQSFSLGELWEHGTLGATP